MQLKEHQISFKFAGGVETKMDSKAVPPVRLLALENGVFTRAISIKKRNGYAREPRAIEGTAEIATGAMKLAVRDDEVLLFTRNRCYSKLENGWTDAGACISAVGSDRPVVNTGTAQTMPDHATNGGITAYAWEDSTGGVWWTVEDDTSGRVYRAPAQADGLGERPRCVAVGDAIHIYYAVPSANRIYVIVVNPSAPSAAQTPAILVSDLSAANPVYDAVATDRDATPSAIAWCKEGSTSARIGYVHAGGALGTPGNGNPSPIVHAVAMAAASPLALSYQDEVLVVTVQTATDVTSYFFDSPPGIDPIAFDAAVDAFTATAVLRIATTFTTDAVLWVAAEETAAEASEHYCLANSITAGVAGTEQTLRSVGLAARAFAIDEDAFAVFVHATTFFNAYMTFRLSDFYPVGRHIPGAAVGLPAHTHLSTVHVVDYVASFVLPQKTRLQSENNDQFGESALQRMTINFDDLDTHQTAQMGRGLYLAAACPQHYDGRLWTEQGFNVGPELIETVAATGGSMTVDSTYQYKVWYEWTDAQGEIHRGPESPGVTAVTGGADTQVTLTLPTLRLTRKSNVRICVGRSLPGDVARLWRVTSLDPTTEGAVANGYIANDATGDSVSFVDRLSDDDLELQEPLYTTGGVLSNDPSALGSIVTAGKNRLFFTDAQNGNIVRFSQRLATGYGVEIGPELMHDVDPYGGNITALAVMDDVVFVFKASCIFAFNGDGPYENGGTSDSTTITGFSSTQIITSDVGCEDPSSIVLTPEGLMFKSNKGIQILTRARQVMPVGDPVEAYNAQTIRRATVLPGRTGVVFLTDEGLTLYFDYKFGQWSTFTNHEGYDAVVAGGTYYYLRTDGYVFRETLDEYSDGGSRIRLRFETSWLHMQDVLQSWQRFWYLHLLGTWTSPHQFGVSYRLSYEDNWCEPTWLDATGGTDSTGWMTGSGVMAIGQDPLIGTVYGHGVYGDGVYGGTPDDPYRWRFGIHEDGEAIQFRFEDFEKSGLAGASFELTEMKITGGVMPDPAHRRARSM